MSGSSISPAKVCQSEVQIRPLSQPANVEAIKTFKNLVKTCIGIKGKLKIIGSLAGGHVTLTSSSSRLLQNVSVHNNFLKFIISSARSHLKSYGDNGLLCAFLTSLILDRSLDLPYPNGSISEITEYFSQTYLDYLTSPIAHCVIDIDFSDSSHLLTIIQNVLSSKPGCVLSQKQILHLSILILKAFLNSVPDASLLCAKKLSHVAFATLEGTSADKCCLYDGLLLRCPEIVNSALSASLQLLSALKVALFTTSLAGDVAFPASHLEVKNVNVWKVVQSHLIAISERLISDGVHVVACQKVVHPVLKKQLENNKILVMERLGLDSTEHLKDVSGAVPISSLSTSCKMTYGYVTGFESIRLGKKLHYLLRNKEHPFQTLLLCNYNEESLNETKVVCKQALDTLYRLLQSHKTCYGGGCTETHVAAVLEDMVKRDISEVAKELDYSPSHILAVLQNFISCITEVAVAFHQGSQLSFATDAVHHHLWRLEGENFPSSGATCMCGSYRAEDVAHTQWRMCGLHTAVNYLCDENKETASLIQHVAQKPNLLDELSARVNALRVAFETASVLMTINLCILNQN